MSSMGVLVDAADLARPRELGVALVRPAILEAIHQREAALRIQALHRLALLRLAIPAAQRLSTLRARALGEIGEERVLHLAAHDAAAHQKRIDLEEAGRYAAHDPDADEAHVAEAIGEA